MRNNKVSANDDQDHEESIEHIPEIGKIERQFKSLTESISTCDVRRAILISNLLGCENMTLDNVRRLRNLATKFNEECVCIPKREVQNL